MTFAARIVLRWMPNTARSVYAEMSAARERLLLDAFGEAISLAGPRSSVRLHPSLDVQTTGQLPRQASSPGEES